MKTNKNAESLPSLWNSTKGRFLSVEILLSALNFLWRKNFINWMLLLPNKNNSSKLFLALSEICRKQIIAGQVEKCLANHWERHIFSWLSKSYVQSISVTWCCLWCKHRVLSEVFTKVHAPNPYFNNAAAYLSADLMMPRELLDSMLLMKKGILAAVCNGNMTEMVTCADIAGT